MDGWSTNLFLGQKAYFRVLLLSVSGRVLFNESIALRELRYPLLVWYFESMVFRLSLSVGYVSFSHLETKNLNPMHLGYIAWWEAWSWHQRKGTSFWRRTFEDTSWVSVLHTSSTPFWNSGDRFSTNICFTKKKSTPLGFTCMYLIHRKYF